MSEEQATDLRRLYGVRVFRSRYVRPGDMVVMGHFEKPADWADLSDERRIEEAVKRGAIIVIHDEREP